VVRSKLKTGSSGVTIHQPARKRRLLGTLLGALGASPLLWGLACAIWGPSTVGVWEHPAWVDALGAVLFLGGIGLVVLSQATMGRAWRIGIDAAPTSLVTAGPFGWVRNPIYDGMMLMSLGLVAATPALWTLFGTVAYATLIQIQVRQEERHLVELHGAPYQAYLARVGRFIPGLGRVGA
jgi:protein-S-isoprenylcysteine O-methyltransferase Ste14